MADVICMTSRGMQVTQCSPFIRHGRYRSHTVPVLWSSYIALKTDWAKTCNTWLCLYIRLLWNQLKAQKTPTEWPILLSPGTMTLKRCWRATRNPSNWRPWRGLSGWADWWPYPQNKELYMKNKAHNRYHYVVVYTFNFERNVWFSHIPNEQFQCFCTEQYVSDDIDET